MEGFIKSKIFIVIKENQVILIYLGVNIFVVFIFYDMDFNGELKKISKRRYLFIYYFQIEKIR